MVNIIFQRKKPLVSVPPYTWPVSQMKKFAVERATAQEYMMKVAARYLESDSPPPWHSCSNTTEVLNKEEDPNSDVEFGIAYTVFSSYILRQEGKCDSIVVFEMPALTRSYECMWYYGSHVPQRLQESIDKRIATLRLKEVVSGIVRKQVGTDDSCGDESQRALGIRSD